MWARFYCSPLGPDANMPRMNGRKRLLLISLATGFIAVQCLSSDSEKSVPAPAAYTGSASCRECHEKFYQLWAPSHHGLAMQPWSIARTNLTPQHTPLRIGTNAYQVVISEGVVVEGGATDTKRYAIEQTLGGKNVLYFLTPYKRGRLQVLPIAYDIRRKEWYDTAASAVRHSGMMGDEALHWTESPYTFNTACYNCHVSQLTNNYTLNTDSYQTTWREPGINCETCHGPASEHVRTARALPKGQPMKDLKLISMRTFSPQQVNSACGTCHAKMYPITSSFTPGERYFDHFGLSAMEHTDWYPDGRDLGENFTYTSWQMSPCVKAGKLDCVACHTSSGRYRFKGDRANDACLPCHDEKVKSVNVHSHHAAGTDGAKCISCHMPMTEFARMLRSDHSMRPPMPAATIAFGSPNACNICHTNQTASWADAEVRRWRKRDYQAPTLQRASWIAAARKQDWSRLPEMVKYLSTAGREEIWAASLIQLLRPCEHESKWPAILACLNDPSPMVRAAAIDALGDALRADLIPQLAAATRDPFRLVRIRAAAALASVPREAIAESERRSLDSATQELLDSFSSRPDVPSSYHNLGNFHLSRHEAPKAIEAFQTALKLEPRDITSLANLALAYNLAGQNDKAEASLQEAVRLEPTNAAINLNFAMLLAERGKMEAAEKTFRTAFKADPRSAQAAFNLGVLLAEKHPEESLQWCRRAVELRPGEPRYAYTLAFYQLQNGSPREAAFTLEKLIARKPAYPDAYALLGQIYARQNKSREALAVYKQAAENTNLDRDQRTRFAGLARSLGSE
jgi:Tfp pilus assembly protein PilF